MKKENSQPKINLPQQLSVEMEVESQCRSEVQEGRWETEHQRKQEEQERNFKMEWVQQSQNQWQQQQQQTQYEQQHQLCMQEKSCQVHKSKCTQELRKEHRPTHEIERICAVRVEECKLRHKNRMSTKSLLNRMESGSASTVSGAIIFKSDYDQTKKIDVQVSFGSSTSSSGGSGFSVGSS